MSRVTELLGYDFHKVPLLQGISLAGKELLECDDRKVVGSRLRRLIEASEKPEEYAMEVQPRFQSNLEFLRSMKKLTKVRDYVFLEIF